MQNTDANATKSQAIRARANRRAKADPKASSQKAATVRKQRADWRSAEARRMKAAGYTVPQIMEYLGASRTTVYDLLRRPYEAPQQMSFSDC